MAPRKRLAIVPKSVVDRLLTAAGDDLVLVGGQALKLWMDRYAIAMPPRIAYVSRDVDFLAPSAADVESVRRGVRARAVEVRLPEVTFRVMHPLDVLQSRLENLAGLAEKQNELGKAQLHAAIRVARAFQRDAAASDDAPHARRPRALRYAAFIERLARGAAGKKVAARDGLCIADAIEPDVVPSREFRENKLPRLLPLMSAERQRELARP